MYGIFHSSLLHLKPFFSWHLLWTQHFLGIERLGAFSRIAQQTSDTARNKRQAVWLPQQCFLQVKLKFGPFATNILKGKSPTAFQIFPENNCHADLQAGWNTKTLSVLYFRTDSWYLFSGLKLRKKWLFFHSGMIDNFPELGKIKPGNSKTRSVMLKLQRYLVWLFLTTNTGYLFSMLEATGRSWDGELSGKKHESVSVGL